MHRKAEETKKKKKKTRCCTANVPISEGNSYECTNPENMNAIMSLCHFCENHGPSIIFSTHPVRQSDPHPDEKSAEPSNSRRVSPTVSTDTSKIRKPDTCDGCHSMHGGYVSHDDDAGVSYVSKQYPHHPLVFSMVRQACVRSLSCEVCPGREGPIFFGDEQRGHVVSYTFYIPDSHSRGLQRWYSILVVMMDKIYLLNSWPFLVPNIQSLTDIILAKAKVVYDQEQAKCPQKPFRLQTGMTPSNFRQQRGVSKSPRSLVELTDDKNIFKLLHVAFTWIIKACGSRLTETFLEGPPTEDSIIDMEKQEETEEGFIKLFSKKLSTDTELKQPQHDHCCNNTVLGKVHPVTFLRQLRKTVGKDNFRCLVYHTIVGNQIILRGDNPTIVMSAVNSLKVLIPNGCSRAIVYTDTYEDSWKCNILGLSLMGRIPEHVKLNDRYIVLTFSPKVQSSPNIAAAIADPPLAGSVNGLEQVPIELTMMEQVPIDLTMNISSSIDCTAQQSCSLPDEVKQGIHSENGTPPASPSNTHLDNLDDFNLEVQTEKKLLDKTPHLLDKIVLAIENENLSESITDKILSCLKEEWMNKVKVLFKFTKAGGGRSDDDTKKLVQIIGASSEDVDLLKFWMTGLSVHYRTHIMTTTKQFASFK